MVKAFFIILFIYPVFCFAQVNVVYQPKESVKNTPITYYSTYACSLCKDTMVEAMQVEVFFIVNPTEDVEGVELLTRLTNLKTLWLEGNDSDDFEEYGNKDFDRFIFSSSLKNIHLYRIDNTERFTKYVKKRRKDIQIIYD